MDVPECGVGPAASTRNPGGAASTRNPSASSLPPYGSPPSSSSPWMTEIKGTCSVDIARTPPGTSVPLNWYQYLERWAGVGVIVFFYAPPSPRARARAGTRTRRTPARVDTSQAQRTRPLSDLYQCTVSQK